MSTQNQRTEPELSAAGPGQGASSQYSQFQQGQSQQYGSYRSSQGGPGAQAQRSYAYEQVHSMKAFLCTELSGYLCV